MNIELLTEFFGWCTLVNVAVLCFMTIMMASGGNRFAKRVHSRMFDVSEDQLDQVYFKYLANYKMAIMVFNLTPYIALKLMA